MSAKSKPSSSLGGPVTTKTQRAGNEPTPSVTSAAPQEVAEEAWLAKGIRHISFLSYLWILDLFF